MKFHNEYYLVPRKKTIWILAANRVGAVLFKKESGQPLKFLQRFENPSGRLREKDLVSDSPGRINSSNFSGMVKHSFGREKVWHDNAARQFAKKIVAEIKALNIARHPIHLILIAEPHFLGFLRQAFARSKNWLKRWDIPVEIKFINTNAVDRRVRAFMKERTLY